MCLQASSQQASQPTKKKPVDATSAAGGSADTLEQRQKEARKWINDWRARWGASPHMVLGLEGPGRRGGVEGEQVCSACFVLYDVVIMQRSWAQRAGGWGVTQKLCGLDIHYAAVMLFSVSSRGLWLWQGQVFKSGLLYIGEYIHRYMVIYLPVY